MRAFSVLLTCVLIGVATPVLAGKGGGGHDDDRKRVEAARERGDVLPLARIVEQLRAQGYTGEVLDIELDEDDGRLIYEVYMLGGDGRRTELDVDPASGRVLAVDRD